MTAFIQLEKQMFEEKEEAENDKKWAKDTYWGVSEYDLQDKEYTGYRYDDHSDISD